MLAQQDDVLEAVDDHAVDDRLVDRREDRAGNIDRSRRLRVQVPAGDRERIDRRHQRIAQLARDVEALRLGGEGVAAEHGMRTALLDAPVHHQNRRLALLVNGGIDLRVGHQLDFKRRFLLLPGRRADRRKHARRRHCQHHHGLFHAQHPLELDGQVSQGCPDVQIGFDRRQDRRCRQPSENLHRFGASPKEGGRAEEAGHRPSTSRAAIERRRSRAAQGAGRARSQAMIPGNEPAGFHCAEPDAGPIATTGGPPREDRRRLRPSTLGLPATHHVGGGYGSIHVAFRAGANPTGTSATSFIALISTTDMSLVCSLAT